MDPIAQEEFHRALLMTTARGHTQRASVETRAREPHGDPEYADNLMAQWGYGSYSAQETQKLAHLARKAGAVGGYLKELAALGSHGASPQNCSTDLMDPIRKVLGRAIIPIYVALVPMFVAKSESGKPEPELTTAGLLLPHVWVWFLYTYYRAEFFTRFLGCTEGSVTGKLKKFWSSFHTNDPRRLPCFNDANFDATTIPIGVHGDAVPCTKKDSLNVLSFFGMMGDDATAQLCFFMFGLVRSCKVVIAVMGEFTNWDSGSTNDAVWSVFVWSFFGARY